MEHLEEFSKIQKFAEAKAQDKTLMIKHREIRKKVYTCNDDTLKLL